MSSFSMAICDDAKKDLPDVDCLRVIHSGETVEDIILIGPNGPLDKNLILRNDKQLRALMDEIESDDFKHTLRV